MVNEENAAVKMRFFEENGLCQNRGVDSVLLEEDAYLFKRLDNNLIIAGGAENGLLNGFTPYWNFLVLGNTVLTTPYCFPYKYFQLSKMSSKHPGSNTEQQTITMQEMLIMNLGKAIIH